jgi:ABC-type dipeptide/oligopeptide/nickel transport systems, permease components
MTVNPILPDPVENDLEALAATGQPPAAGRAVASQWKLMWWQFRRHRLAMASAVVLFLIFLVAAFCEFVAPFDPLAFTPRYTYAPPQAIHLFDRDETGSWCCGPTSTASRSPSTRPRCAGSSSSIPR